MSPRSATGCTIYQAGRRHTPSATDGFAAACRDAGVGFSFGFPVTAPVRDAVATLAQAAELGSEQGWTVWYRAIEPDGTIRDGAWLAEASGW